MRIQFHYRANEDPADGHFYTGVAVRSGQVIYAQPQGRLTRKEMLSIFVRWIKDMKPDRVECFIDGADQSVELSTFSIKAIVDGSITADDLYIGPDNTVTQETADAGNEQ